MQERRRVYLVRRGNEYLQCLKGQDGETDLSKYAKVFSIYRYNAAQFPDIPSAQQTIQAIAGEDRQEWRVTRYDKLTYQEAEICG